MGRREKPDTRDKGAEVLRLMREESMSTEQALIKVGMSKGAFFYLVQRDEQFADDYARAREILLHVMALELKEIADTPVIGKTRTIKADGGIEEREGDMIEHRRLQIDARKWMLAKLMPKVYGDRQQIEHSGSISIAEALRQAREKRRGEA